MKRCRRCNAALPDNNPMVQSGGRVIQPALWEAMAREWCVECQKAFLRDMEDLDEKYHDAVDAQDGKRWEQKEFAYLRMRYKLGVPKGLFISGHKKFIHRRRPDLAERRNYED